MKANLDSVWNVHVHVPRLKKIASDEAGSEGRFPNLVKKVKFSGSFRQLQMF
jgi:hypothetical protein